MAMSFPEECCSAKAQQLASDRPAVCLIMNSGPGHHTGSSLALNDLMEPGEDVWPNRAVGVLPNQKTNMLQRYTGVTVVVQQPFHTARRGLMKRHHRLRRYHATSRVDDAKDRRYQR